MVPEKVPPPGLNYATVEKRREKGRVVEILTRVVFGTMAAVVAALARSKVSRWINTSFLERQNATDRHHNARKVRKTYTFSKDWRVHEAMTYFTMYSYNFCWPVRTLDERDEQGRIRKRTPAMAAGLADHVWTMREWVTMPLFNAAKTPTFRLRWGFVGLERFLALTPRPRWIGLGQSSLLDRLSERVELEIQLLSDFSAAPTNPQQLLCLGCNLRRHHRSTTCHTRPVERFHASIAILTDATNDTVLRDAKIPRISTWRHAS